MRQLTCGNDIGRWASTTVRKLQVPEGGNQHGPCSTQTRQGTSDLDSLVARHNSNTATHTHTRTHTRTQSSTESISFPSLFTPPPSLPLCWLLLCRRKSQHPSFCMMRSSLASMASRRASTSPDGREPGGLLPRLVLVVAAASRFFRKISANPPAPPGFAPPLDGAEEGAGGLGLLLVLALALALGAAFGGVTGGDEGIGRRGAPEGETEGRGRDAGLGRCGNRRGHGA